MSLKYIVINDACHKSTSILACYEFCICCSQYTLKEYIELRAVGQSRLYLTRWLFTVISYVFQHQRSFTISLHAELIVNIPHPPCVYPRLSCALSVREGTSSSYPLLLLRVPPLSLLREGEPREGQSDFRQADWQLRAQPPACSEQQMQTRRCGGEGEKRTFERSQLASSSRSSTRRGVSFHSPRVVCIIYGSLEEEVAAVDGSVQREQRQTHNAPGVNGGEATTPRRSRSPI